MRMIVLTPKAKSDLDGIWDYSVRNWGVMRAEKYIRDIWAVLENQAEQASCEDTEAHVRAGYSKKRIESHVLFFKSDDVKIDVIRILHQSMDFERHL